MTYRFIAACLLTWVACAVWGQRVPSLEEVVAGRVIETNWGGAVRWMPDGERYSQVERRADGLYEVVTYRAKDGQRQVLIPAEQLINPATGKQLWVRSFQLDAEGKQALIYTNTRRVWRYDTRGDYWVLRLADGHLQQLGKGLPEASLMFAKFAPQADRVAYVSGNNIYVERLADGERTALTTDGGADCVNGTFDWVYEEEFGCRDGFRWSPDGQSVAYWQSDTRGTGWFDIINNVDSLYPTIQRFPYPKAGTRNAAVKVGTVSAAGGATTWINLPGDARENYIPRMDFIPGTDELFIQQMNRQQNTNRVWIARVGETAAENIFTDTDAAWLETNDQVTWLKENRWFTWQSERDGWRHIYRISRDGKQVVPITRGAYDVVEELGMDLKRGVVYFIASPDNFTQRYLYEAPLFGQKEARRLSPADQSGQHRYSLAPGGRWAVHTFSNAATPPVVDRIALPSHRRVELITDNQKAREQWEALGLKSKEFVKVKSDSLLLDAWMIKPANFDPSRRYPVIIDVYGEPANATVTDVWQGGSLWHQYLANQGYIVVSIENRGARTPRGREWRKCIYGEVGTLACRDQAQGIQDLGRQFSYIDLSRVGITGWSGGGSQTLNCMFRYPEVFHTGIAVAFVSDQRLYDTIYQERYMDTPQRNPEGYRKGSPISYAEGLRGNLLLIHGTGDDNVHYQSCEMLVNELVRLGKLFYQISYPMRTHSINEREGTTLHLRRTMTDFWLHNLPAGGR